MSFYILFVFKYIKKELFKFISSYPSFIKDESLFLLIIISFSGQLYLFGKHEILFIVSNIPQGLYPTSHLLLFYHNYMQFKSKNYYFK